MLVAGLEAVAAVERASAKAAALLVPPRHHQRLRQQPLTSHHSSIKPLPLTRQMLLPLPRNVNDLLGCNATASSACKRSSEMWTCALQLGDLIQRV